MKIPGFWLVAGAAAILAAFALLAYGSVQNTKDPGAYYSPATTEAETRVCPARCHYYSVGSGEGTASIRSAR